MSGPPPTSTPPPGAGSLWGGHAGGPAQPAPSGGGPTGSGQLDPLARRLLHAAGVLSVLLVLVLANSLLHGEDEALQLNPVAAAARHVQEVGGGHLSIFVVYDSPALPRPVSASGSGVFNEETDRSRITLDLTNPLTGEQIRLIEISDGEVNYEGGEMVASVLPPGKEWVRTDKSDEGEDETPLTMDESMELLNSSGSVQLVGREPVNGTMTRHYRGEIGLDDLIALLRAKGKDTEADAYERIAGIAPVQLRAEGWVDRRNMLRRLRFVMPMPGEAGEPPMTIDMRMDFFAYGTKPDIEIPDPDSVVDGPLDEPPASTTTT